MAISLESISTGKQLRAPRIVVLGVEKIGKSEFAAGANEPIFIPIKLEEGIDDIDVPKFPTCKTYGEVIECIGVLYNDDVPYKTVVIDSASTLEALIWAETCRLNGGADSIEKVGGGYAKGYVEALKQWREIMEGLDALRAEKNMAAILIGHVTVKQFNDPMLDSYDQYRFDINAKAADALIRWSDCVLFMNYKIYVEEKDVGFNKKRGKSISDNTRHLYTQKRAAHPGGGRGAYGRLPYELPLFWASFQEAVAKANDSAAAGGA